MHINTENPVLFCVHLLILVRLLDQNKNDSQEIERLAIAQNNDTNGVNQKVPHSILLCLTYLCAMYSSCLCLNKF